MKTFLMLSFALLQSLLIHAQPVINGSINPKAGASFQFITFDTAKFEPGEAGPNRIWNFSKVVCTDTATLAYLEPEKTPYADLYPGSNIAMTSDKESYQYFYFDTKGYNMMGDIGYHPDYEAFIETKYQKPEQMLEYPISYQSTFFNENKRVIRYEGYFDVHTTIVTRYLADGYGKLILPYGTFTQALRLKIETAFHDSLTNGERFALFTQYETKYQWFVAEIAAPILTISKTERVNENGETQTYTDNTMAIVLKENYLSRRDVFPFDLRVGQGNSNDRTFIFFNLDISAEVKLEVLDMTGQTLMIPLKGMMKEGLQNLEINTDSLVPGIYVIRLSSGSRTESLKWVKSK